VARVFVRPEAVDRERVHFDAAETRHLRTVLRLRPGAVVEATDGTGRLYTVRLLTLDPGGASGAIEGRTEPARESPCAITLGQAVLKGERMSWLVQKATELGVARIVPLATARVVVRPAGEPGPQARWQRIAREAVKQCGRVVVPSVEPPRELAALLAETPRPDASWLLSEDGGEPVAAAARATPRPARLLLLVGPEGGFTAAEVALARRAGARPVSLGPRVLRGESAGLVAVTLGQYLFGDLGGRVPGPASP
jgi:16S rRNA (uracil1498-N3)-methyltransferase